MQPGQTLSKWWQDYVCGRLCTPQAICEAARAEQPVPSPRFDGPPAPDPTWKIPERLKAPGWFASESYARQSFRADWSDTDPRLMHWAAHFVEAARKWEIPLYVHTAMRSEVEQTKVFKAGNSKTPYPRSAHNVGEAVDIVHGVFHWEMNKEEWKFLHALGRLSLDRVNAELPKARKLALTWGGEWSFYDPAHWEISDYKQRIRRLPPSDPLNMPPKAILAGRFHLRPA